MSRRLLACLVTSTLLAGAAGTAVARPRLPGPVEGVLAPLAPTRTPLVGGVTMTQALPGTGVVVTLWGALSTSDWTCVEVVDVTQPPTVICEDQGTDPALTTWYCHQLVVTAQAPGLTSRVRGQGSCDQVRTPVPPSTVAGATVSTAEVAGPGSDLNFATLDRDTHYLVCQAWGPGNSPVPLAPWTVQCDEP